MNDPRERARPMWAAVTMMPASTVVGLGLGWAIDRACGSSPVWTAILGITAPIVVLVDIIRRGIR